MGGGQSLPCPPVRAQITETPTPARRMSIDRITASCPNAGSLWASTDHLLEPAFAGVWSNIFPKSPCPPQRFGQFSVSSQSKAYVGFGVSPSGASLHDLWELDADALTWREIPLTGHEIGDCVSSPATIAGTVVYVFNVTSAELYSIDTTTGSVALLPSHGASPSPRSSPVLQHVDGELVLWGGFNGEWLTSLSVYDIATGEWTETNPKVAGRAGTSWALVGETVYVFGGGDMIKIDAPQRSVQVIPCKGTPPPSDSVEGQMLSLGECLLYFGGKSANCWAFPYAFDLVKETWSIFFVAPDESTVHMSDGRVSDTGIFMLPRIHGFGACYSPAKKRAVGFFGVPQSEQSPLYVIDVAEALSVRHLYDDMRTVMAETGETVKGSRPIPAIVRSSQSFEEPVGPESLVESL